MLTNNSTYVHACNLETYENNKCNLRSLCAFFFDFLHEIALKTSKFSPPAGSKISFQQLFSHGFSCTILLQNARFTHAHKIDRVMNEKPDLHPAMQCQKGREPRFESLTPRGTFLDETLIRVCIIIHKHSTYMY